MSVNLALKYSTKVDEKFERESQASLVTNNSYDFDGVDTVKVYSIGTVAMGDYNRTGPGSGNWSRYGAVSNLANDVQTLKVLKDRSWTFSIDKGDYKQSEMVMNAGKACSRQISQVIIPEYDKYVFNKLAAIALGNTGHSSTTASTKQTAYEQFLTAQEVLGNANVPDQGRICLCSYKFANLMKQDPAFMRDSNTSQDMLIKGVLGEVDGVKIVKVPASRLPDKCEFILTHPCACVAPKQLWEYKIHTDAPGISGWLCEGRVLYDAFVLENKKDAIYAKFSGTPSDVTPETNVMASTAVSGG